MQSTNSFETIESQKNSKKIQFGLWTVKKPTTESQKSKSRTVLTLSQEKVGEQKNLGGDLTFFTTNWQKV